MALLLIHESGKEYLVQAGKDAHTDKGIIKKEDLVPGRVVRSHKRERFLVVEPRLKDIVQEMRMGAKPLFEYDTGMFSALLGMDRGKTVLEAGTGSGGATIIFANSVWPSKVYSFETEERFYKVARENLDLAGIDNVELINDDVRNAENYVKKVDSIFLDLQNPEEVIPSVSGLLVPGGFLGVYTPVFDSVKPVWKEMERLGYVSIRAIELGHRRIIVKKYARLGEKLMGFPGIFIWARKFGT